MSSGDQKINQSNSSFYIEDIQSFGMNMTFISSSEVKYSLFPTSQDEIDGTFMTKICIFFIIYIFKHNRFLHYNMTSYTIVHYIILMITFFNVSVGQNHNLIMCLSAKTETTRAGAGKVKIQENPNNLLPKCSL